MSCSIVALRQPNIPACHTMLYSPRALLQDWRLYTDVNPMNHQHMPYQRWQTALLRQMWLRLGRLHVQASMHLQCLECEVSLKRQFTTAVFSVQGRLLHDPGPNRLDESAARVRFASKPLSSTLLGEALRRHSGPPTAQGAPDVCEPTQHLQLQLPSQLLRRSRSVRMHLGIAMREALLPQQPQHPLSCQGHRTAGLAEAAGVNPASHPAACTSSGMCIQGGRASAKRGSTRRSWLSAPLR